MPLAPGDLFAGYRIIRQLGTGGMGAVYVAQHPRLPRADALKLLHASLTVDPAFVARFLREADVVAGLSHRNIVPVLDRGEEAGQLWFTMPYIEGTDLEGALRAEHPLPTARVAHIVSEVASALDFAHEHGVLHRDVKPANVLLGRSSEGDPEPVLLTDFGIAKTMTESTSHTRTGQVVATFDYASPEAIESRPVTASSDLYSLGCLSFTILTGRVPFPGGTVLAALHGHLALPPPRVTELVPEFPVAVDDVIARAMAKVPADRYPTCRAFAEDLATALANAPRVAAALDAAPRETGSGPASDTQPGGPTYRRRAATGVVLDFPPPTGSAPVSPQRVQAAPLPVQVDERPFPGRETQVYVPPASIRMPLRPDFTLVTGPLPVNDAVPLLDHQPEVEELCDWLRKSSRGAILVTGFRGVGKTTLVDRGLAELRTHLAECPGGPVPLVEVRLNVARPIQPDELLIKLIRNLYEALHRAGALERLPEETQQRLDVAYQRTSQSLKEIRGTASERGGELGLTAAASAWNVATPAVKLTGKRTRSRSTELNYLTYTLTDAEHDFTGIVDEIASQRPAPAPPWWAFWRHPPAPWRGRLVVVLDELDKLTSDETGEQCLTGLLTALKNVFTAAGIHFIFVAGPDVTDLARADSMRGSGVYDAVFQAKLYLPCISARAPRVLLRALSAREADHLDAVCDYLTYRSRGLPRLLLGALSSHVNWRVHPPTLVLQGQQAMVVEFFAMLNRRITLLTPPPFTPLSHPIDHDRFRMGAYLVTEWALRRGSMTFTDRDVEEDRSFRPDPRIVPPDTLRQVLDALSAEEVGVLERSDADRASRTILDVAATERPIYRLAHPVAAAATRTGQAPRELGRVGDGVYVLLEELGRGALGRTYKASRRTDGSLVAIKLLDLPELAHDEVARRRLLREAALVEGLHHPGVVRSGGVVHEKDGTVGLVAEFVDGSPLSKLLTGQPLGRRFAVTVARELAELLAYLGGEGVVRLDLKPSNIVVSPGTHPVVIDLGLATKLGEPSQQPLTVAGTVLGTPRYAPPEQLRGEPVDGRGDLYSMGLILYEMVIGKPARAGRGPQAFAQAVSGDIDLRPLSCSRELRDLLSALVQPDPRQRPQDPAVVAAALSATPEARGAA